VPFLKDIPLLGWAFRSGNQNAVKTNLLMFITPRIIQDQFDMRDITKEHRDGLKEEISAREIYPNRNEQLNNAKIDAVTEAKEFDGTKPTTIKPADSSELKTNDSVNSTENSGSNTPAVINRKYSPDSPGVIQLKVQPKLPKASLNNSSLNTSSTNKRFILLKASDDSEPSENGFVWGKDTKIFGIEVPEGSSMEAIEFFSPGKTLSYSNGDIEIKASVVSNWNDRSSAHSAFAGSTIAWYTLPPKEVMSLGKGSWKIVN
jgi:hypothetical protein